MQALGLLRSVFINCGTGRNGSKQNSNQILRIRILGKGARNLLQLLLIRGQSEVDALANDGSAAPGCQRASIYSINNLSVVNETPCLVPDPVNLSFRARSAVRGARSVRSNRIHQDCRHAGTFEPLVHRRPTCRPDGRTAFGSSSLILYASRFMPCLHNCYCPTGTTRTGSARKSRSGIIRVQSQE